MSGVSFAPTANGPSVWPARASPQRNSCGCLGPFHVRVQPWKLPGLSLKSNRRNKKLFVELLSWKQFQGLQKHGRNSTKDSAYLSPRFPRTLHNHNVAICRAFSLPGLRSLRTSLPSLFYWSKQLQVDLTCILGKGK